MCDVAFCVLTGGADEMVYGWDLRYMDAGPVVGFEGHGDTVYSLAIEPRHGTLLSGGAGHAINCWDMETRAQPNAIIPWTYHNVMPCWVVFYLWD
jgi:WD40 repeat protein